MGKAVPILLLFAVLTAFCDLGRTYCPSVAEQYYKDMMERLEGGLTGEKEALLLSEQKRYDEAFSQIEKINSMVDSGEMDEAAADDMKIKWLSVLSFYPAFQRIWNEYEHVRESGGVFLYDTGYLYVFGRMDNSLAIDFLLISLGIVFAFGNAVAMEDEKNSWNLISATRKGRRAILRQKSACCIICTVILAILPWSFRIAAISKAYPLSLWTQSVSNIPAYYGCGISVPIWGFAAIAISGGIIAAGSVCAAVLCISRWRKSYLQTVFLSMILFVIPNVLALAGLAFCFDR